MAYRMLRRLMFLAVGGLAVGCGSGAAGDATSPAVTDDPPASADGLPTSNPDAPPASADAPPASGDALPANPGGGGGAQSPEGLCRELCRSVDAANCNAGDLSDAIAAICGTGCQLPPQYQTCASETAAALSCILDIDGLCSTEPSEGEAQSCLQAIGRISQCAAGEGDPTPDPPAGQSCSMAGDQCAGCGTVCELCECASTDPATECTALCM